MFLKQQPNKSVARHSEGGFSLIEVAIGLVVISILMLPMIKTYDIYISQKKTSITRGVTTIVKAALLKHYQKYGVYPTPANPGIAQGQPGFGAAASVGVGWPVCTITSNTVCRTASTGFGSDFVLIGDVPFAALGIPYKSTVDGFGRKLKYAVTQSLATIPTDFDDTEGAIEIQDDLGATIYTAGATAPRAHFAVVSFGPDGMGAFTLGGLQSLACTAGSSQFTNCNNDGVFRNNYSAVYGKNLLYEGNGASKFDDYVTVTNTTSFGVWSYIPNSGLSIEAKNGGNIRIGPPCSPCVPTSHVEVIGDVSANTITTSRFCPSGESSCYDEMSPGVPLFDPPPRKTFNGSTNIGFFSPTMLTGAPVLRPVNTVNYPNSTMAQGGVEGAGIRCYNNYALKGIRSYDEVCATGANTTILSSPRIWDASTMTGSNCASGTYAVGITINATGDKFSLNCE